MCQQEKEQTLELPPLMTNKQIHTHSNTLSRAPKQPHFQPLSHEAGQKERDILWLWMMARRWSGKESSSASPVPVCQCAAHSVCVLGRLLSQFPEGVLFSITCITQNLSTQHSLTETKPQAVRGLCGLSVSDE